MNTQTSDLVTAIKAHPVTRFFLWMLAGVWTGLAFIGLLTICNLAAAHLYWRW